MKQNTPSSVSPIARFLIVVASFVIVVAGMQAAQALLVPFLLSLFLAILCSPPLSWMKERGTPTSVAILIIIAIVAISSVLVGAVVSSSIQSFRGDLPIYQERLGLLTAQLFDALSGLGLSIDFGQLRESFDPSTALSFAGSTLSSLGNMMTNALLILLTVVFILTEEIGFSDKLKVANSNSKKTLEAVRRFTRSVNSYMAIKTVMSLITGVVILIWLWVLKVDYFVLWGLLAFMLNFVPTLGSILAAVPAVLLALVQLGPTHALLTAAGFVVVNFGVGNVIEPRVMGKGLDLSALVVFLSLVFWGWILGPIGMLLSIPLTITVKIALESFDDTQWLGVMLGSGREAQDRLKT